MTLLTLSYKKSKMSAILGSIVYILILSIRRKAVKKIESAKSAKSVMSFFLLNLMSFPKFSRQFFDYFPKLVVRVIRNAVNKFSTTVNSFRKM